ncbi:hypothetical protein JCM6882_008059 [Rhodosporidiobolus microsporus]
MDGPFATPTVRAGNPLSDALDAEGAATPRPSPAPFTAPSSSSAYPIPTSSRRPLASPPLSPRAGAATAKTRMPPPTARARSPPMKRQGSGGGAAPSSSPSSPAALPPRPSMHPQHSQHSQPAPTASELASFAALCHSLYYTKSPLAARQVDSTLSKLPPSFRTPYAREMARVRAEFHRAEEVRRRALVEKALEETIPSGTVKRALQISPESTSTAALRSSKARQLRREGLKAFLAAHCVQGLPGPHPFLRSLFAALWLQGLDTGRGGAGGRCVEWEVDLGVFAEGGTGEGWAREAVEVLKGVLGMSDRPTEPSHTDTNSTRTSYFDSTVHGASSSSRASSIAEPHGVALTVTAPSLVDEHGVLLPRGSNSSAHSGTGTSGSKRPAPPVPPHRGSMSARARSKSDPFLTAEEKAASKATSAATLGGGESPSPSESPSPPQPPSPDLAAGAADDSTPFLPPSSPSSPAPPPPSSPSPNSSASPAPPPALKPAYRTLTLPPFLTNPECRSLCRLFPAFISSPTKPKARFRSNSASLKEQARVKAAEEVGEAGKAEGAVEEGGRGGRVGHGDLRIGRQERERGWKGGWWERWCGWWRGVFGVA